MSPVVTIAMKEFRDGLRNRWVITAVAFLAGLAVVLALLGSAPVGTIKASPLSVVIASLASLSVYLVPLLALMISYDAIAGERDRGTLLLLLSYPVRRWQILAGKFLGHLSIITVAVAAGYGLAGIILTAATGVSLSDIAALANLILGSVLLGTVFIFLGYVVSIHSYERSAAIGVAFGLWLALVVIYDLALFGLLIWDSGQSIRENVFAGLLLFNPADAFRIYVLTSIDEVNATAGLAGIGKQAGFGAGYGVLSMVLWAILAALLALTTFRRSEL